MKIGIDNLELEEAKNIILWQFGNAPRLGKLIQNDVDFYNKNVKGFIEDFYNDVFNLKTANSFGLNVWGDILNAKRPVIPPMNYSLDTDNVLRLYNPDTGKWHSFWLTGNTNALTIEKSPADNITLYPSQLDDEQYRLCLLARIFLLRSNMSIKDINKYLSIMFDGREVVATDNLDMTISIKFGYQPSDTELMLITSDTFAPRPAGVFLNYGIDLKTNVFGFDEAQKKTWATNDPETFTEYQAPFYQL